MKKKPDQILSPALKAMADPTRLRILLMLEPKARSVGEIASFFDQSQPTISRHLQALERAELVTRQKSGQHVLYAINTTILRNVCISLTSCFPCCCLTVSTDLSGESTPAVPVDPPQRIDRLRPKRKERT